MVAAIRAGESLRSVAHRFRVSPSVVHRWVKRSEEQDLESVDWDDRSSVPHHQPNHTDKEIEDLIIATRIWLKEQSDLGEYGAEAVHEELLKQGHENIPSIRTINRIFARRNVLERRGRRRSSSPPKGWYLPDVARGESEIDQVDLVEGLKIKNGPLVEVMNVISLHGSLVSSWPKEASIKAKDVVEALIEHWREWGLPHYAQFDNDTLFQGAHQHPNVISRVMRLCLSLGVIPVFVPPGERGYQAAIEGYNGLWQAKVWARFSHESLNGVQKTSQRYVNAHRNRTRQRRDNAPERACFPTEWRLDLQYHPADYPGARLVYIRRTNQQGEVSLLGQTMPVNPSWAGRLVRSEVLLGESKIRFYQLRRRKPNEQPILSEIKHELPQKKFRE